MITMYEKVNPSHPDKVADRIAGAMVDLAYSREKDPRVAVEVLIGHAYCYIIAESSVDFSFEDVLPIVERIAGKGIVTRLLSKQQDSHLATNQVGAFRCGDNGIFKGCRVTEEQKALTKIMQSLYGDLPYDGKAVLDGCDLCLCQSNASKAELRHALATYAPEYRATINPLGFWTGGLDVDTGATNRKLGSDMGDAVTGGGLHGKDLSKSDVTVNIYAHLMAQGTDSPVQLSCAIGDETVGGIPYQQMIDTARAYIKRIGGFEKLAEWGLIR